jgi:hypothetical protein
MQFLIGGHTYNVLATYSCFGWVCWQIFVDVAIDAVMFQTYVRDRLANAIGPTAFCIIDNTSIHHTAESEEALEEAFEGRFLYSVPYCFMDKPCGS